MRKRTLSNALGYMSILGSLTVVIEIGVNAIPHFPTIDLPLNTLLMMWIGAFFLAIVAGILGSRRWMMAALLPIIMFVLALAVVYLNEPRQSGNSFNEAAQPRRR